jgi:hypothetical protein
MTCYITPNTPTNMSKTCITWTHLSSNSILKEANCLLRFQWFKTGSKWVLLFTICLAFSTCLDWSSNKVIQLLAKAHNYVYQY